LEDQGKKVFFWYLSFVLHSDSLFFSREHATLARLSLRGDIQIHFSTAVWPIVYKRSSNRVWIWRAALNTLCAWPESENICYYSEDI